MTSQALQIAKQVMKEDHKVLDVLGSENFTQIKKQKGEDIIDEIIKLVPKSTEGKVLAGFAILVGLTVLDSALKK